MTDIYTLKHSGFGEDKYGKPIIDSELGPYLDPDPATKYTEGIELTLRDKTSEKIFYILIKDREGSYCSIYEEKENGKLVQISITDPSAKMGAIKLKNLECFLECIQLEQDINKIEQEKHKKLMLAHGWDVKPIEKPLAFRFTA